MAEAKAREAITMRAQVQKELLAKEKVRNWLAAEGEGQGGGGLGVAGQGEGEKLAGCGG